MTFPAPARDLALLVARVAVGIVFLAHGWQKLNTFGVDGTSAAFAQMGVPLPTASAWFAALVETLGGAALIVGAAVPLVGLLLIADMAGAYLFVHAGHGLFLDKNGYEFVLTLAAASLVFAVVGPGRYSVDALLAGRRRDRSAVVV
jgi:putative oxidoreductase